MLQNLSSFNNIFYIEKVLLRVWMYDILIYVVKKFSTIRRFNTIKTLPF